jgi:uncharacterized protein (TIGR02246 family)
MGHDEMVALAYRMHEAANAGDYGAVDGIFAADFVSHPLQTTGREPIRAAWRAIRDKYPELRSEIQDILVDGDRVAIRSTTHGVLTTDGRPGAVLEIVRVAGGRFAELWGVTNVRLR